MDGVYQFKNLFSEQELDQLNQSIYEAMETTSSQPDPMLGRVKLEQIYPPKQIVDKLTDLVNSFSDRKLEMVPTPLFVEYSNKYGEPNLRPHFDGDYNDAILDFQLSANTIWPLGVDLELYEPEDNSAILFNPNYLAHWRPQKIFKDGEYVQMLFFRFYDPVNTSDYSYVANHPDDEVFKRINEYRDLVSVEPRRI